MSYGNKIHGNNKLTRLARPHAERAILGLVAIVDDSAQSAETRMAAARTLLELAYGPVSPPRAEPARAIRPPLAHVQWSPIK